MKILPLLLAVVLLSSCKNDEPVTPGDEKVPSINRGIFILNEGDFSGATKASLSVYDSQNDKLYHNAFESANQGASLGTVGDDMKFYNGKAYIVMSGSDRLVVVSQSNYTQLQYVDLPNADPHDLLIDSVRGNIYVTSLFRRSVAVLNLQTLATVGDTIPVGGSPQGMALVGNKVFVCNSGYGADSTISVIDAITPRVVGTIFTHYGPTGIALAPDGRLWVTCTGKFGGAGRIVIINPTTNAVVDSILFADNLSGPIAIGADGYAYIIGGGGEGPVHRISLSTMVVNLNFISGSFYGLGFDDVAREIVVGDAKSFASDGEVRIYTTAGALRKTLPAKKAPAVFAFKR